MKAIWKDEIIAESDSTIVIEGNHYFPPESVNMEFLRPTETQSTCPWKGLSNYYDVVVGDDVNGDAAWYYPEPKPAAAEIKNHVAFWRGVQITE